MLEDSEECSSNRVGSARVGSEEPSKAAFSNAACRIEVDFFKMEVPMMLMVLMGGMDMKDP